MRSAGCILNDIADYRIDRQVSRTASRPLASGALSLADAISLLSLLLSLALIILLQLDKRLIGLAGAALLLIIAYPYMKRITWWPQLFLGITFNLGAVFAWLTLESSISWALLWLYLAGISWTVGYDTIYAHQDIEDDLRVGVKSTAIRFGKYNRLAIAGCYSLATLGLSLAILESNTPLLALSGALAFAIHTSWQLWRFAPAQPVLALRLFKSNAWLGGLVSALLTFSYVF